MKVWALYPKKNERRVEKTDIAGCREGEERVQSNEVRVKWSTGFGIREVGLGWKEGRGGVPDLKPKAKGKTKRTAAACWGGVLEQGSRVEGEKGQV